MRLRIVALFLMLAVVVASAAPAFADSEVVDHGDGEVPALLGEADVERIKQLQSTPAPYIASPVSPDDSTFLIDNYRYSPTGSAFLNINDGSITPIQQLQLPEDSDLLIVGGTEVVWFDENTLGQVLFDLFDGGYVFLVDRTTGVASIEPIELPFFPLSISPNASRLLVAIFPEYEDLSAGGEFKPPFSIEMPKLRMDPTRQRQPGRSAFYAHTDQRNKLNEDELELGVVDLSTGEYTSLLGLPKDSLLLNYAWAADGSKLALVRDTVKYGEDTAAKRLVDALMYDVMGEYSPKDNPFFVNNVVDLFDFGTGDFRLAALKAVDGNGDTARDLSWSTDGNRLAVGMRKPSRIKGRRYPIYALPESSYLRFYTAQGAPVGEFAAPQINAPDVSFAQYISPDELMIHAVDGMSFKLFYYNQGSGEFRQISSWEGTVYAAAATRQSRQILYGFTSFQHAPDLYRVGWDGQAIARLTWANAENEKANQVRADKVSFKLRSGAVREGYLVQPAGAVFPPKNSPIVLWQEGGPTAPFLNQWSTNVENPTNLLANFGMPVLFVPLPGRLGFGPEFLNALADNRNFGQIDIDEAAEIVEQLVQKGWTASGKVGITGCSYGGYFTSQSITRHPQRYAAANTQCTLLDTASEWHFGLALIGYLEGTTPMADPAEFASDSPINRASAARTPLLMFHGSFDFLPVKFAYDFHDQMQVQGLPVRLLEFNGEGHGLALPEHQLRAAQEQILWFRKYLTGAPAVAALPSSPERISLGQPAKPVAKPVAKPAAKPVAKPAAKPATLTAPPATLRLAPTAKQWLKSL
ncbi:MAG TPA: prolyl oligopeptidase family serine peptidase [Herpetosiphonaceae bacterium]